MSGCPSRTVTTKVCIKNAVSRKWNWIWIISKYSRIWTGLWTEAIRNVGVDRISTRGWYRGVVVRN